MNVAKATGITPRVWFLFGVVIFGGFGALILGTYLEEKVDKVKA